GNSQREPPRNRAAPRRLRRLHVRADDRVEDLSFPVAEHVGAHGTALRLSGPFPIRMCLAGRSYVKRPPPVPPRAGRGAASLVASTARRPHPRGPTPPTAICAGAVPARRSTPCPRFLRRS